MKIGNLNSKITIQRQEVLKDRIGNHTNRWIDYFFCHAQVNKEKGDETFAAGTENDHSDMNVTVRHCSETKQVKAQGFRIRFDDEYYDIQAVDHHGFRNKSITFVCKKVTR